MSAASPERLLEELLPQVRANCLRADAAVAGRFALCGLLLRLRNLHKWERDLPPWQEGAPEEVLAWVSEREEAWDAQGELTPRPIRLAGRDHDPFDADGLNAHLEPLGLHYGAGLVGASLPVFFLAKQERRWRCNGLEIISLGHEFTRDIFFLPGLRQDGRIFLRRGPLPYLLWDLAADPRRSQRRFVGFGLAGYGLDHQQLLRQPTWEALVPVMEGELQSVLWHELGEAGDGELAVGLLRRVWLEHPGSELEHFVRGVKDLLADAGPDGRLKRIIEGRLRGQIGFYPAWLHGYPRLLFPEIDAAVMELMANDDWAAVEQARQLAWRRAVAAVEGLEDVLGRQTGQAARDEAQAKVIGPLTGFRRLPGE